VHLCAQNIVLALWRQQKFYVSQALGAGLAFGFWLLAFGFWFLVFGFWLLAFGFWQSINFNELFG